MPCPVNHPFLDPRTLPGALAYAAGFVVLAAIGIRLVRVLARRASRHFPDPTASTFLAQFAQVTVVLALAILYAHLVPPLRAMGSALLTGASVISVVLGLAAQNTLANLIAGMALLLYQPFRLGDRLVVSTPKGVVTGTITSLTLGYTLLETAAAEEVVVPNIVMATVVIVRELAAPRSANPRSAE